MPVLVSDIVNSANTLLSMVAGVSTQVYGTPQLQQMTEDAYLLMIEEYWWPVLMDYYKVTPNGTTGISTTDLVSVLINHKVQRWEDIEHVFVAGSNFPLPALPPRFNPYTTSGTGGIYVAPSAVNLQRPFKVWPLTTADNLVVRARAFPVLPMSSTDTVYLDKLMLTYLVCYKKAEDDGTNPGQIAKFKAMFEKRLMQMKSAETNQALQLDPRTPIDNLQWSERE